VKFAARCNLNIEPETYRRMLEHAEELQKCAQARVSEEFYRLLRAGAAKRSVELLLETSLLRQLVPALDSVLSAPDRGPGDGAQTDGRLVKARLWAYLAALDRSTARRDSPPSNALVLATLLYPQLRDALHPDTRSIRDVGQFILTSIGPIIEQIKASRRDSDLARRILLAMRWIFPSSNASRRRPRFAGREFLDDALRLHEIVSDAEALDPDIAGRPLLAEGETPSLSPEAEERLARELEAPSEFERRRDGGGGGGRGGGAREPGAPRERAQAASQEPGALSELAAGPGGVRTPIPDLGKLGARANGRLPFLGTGSFGGRWNVQEP
jgi:poly(A) polymerase